VFNAKPRQLYPGERLCAQCVGGWMGCRTVPDVAENIAAHRISNPEPSSP